jgi:hypothetical protein
LQRAGNTPVGCDVVDRLAISGRCLALGVCGCGHWFTVGHTSAVQQLFGIRGLREEEAVFVVSNTDAEEVSKRPHILHGKGIVEPGDDVPE